MKPDAMLINASRGGVVDESALVRALQERRIARAGAGLDVYEREPLPPNHPLLELPRVVTLPHIGSATARTRTAMAMKAADNMVAALQGKRPDNPLNPAVWPLRDRARD